MADPRKGKRGEWNPGDALKAGDPRLLGVAPEALISYERLNLSSEAGIRHVCRDTELAYLISSYRITGAVLAEDSETFAGRKRLSHYLYSCEALRGQQSGDGR